jgi:hypothetical protein
MGGLPLFGLSVRNLFRPILLIPYNDSQENPRIHEDSLFRWLTTGIIHGSTLALGVYNVS